MNCAQRDTRGAPTAPASTPRGSKTRPVLYTPALRETRAVSLPLTNTLRVRLTKVVYVPNREGSGSATFNPAGLLNRR